MDSTYGSLTPPARGLVAIFALYDPRDVSVHYISQSSRPNSRLSSFRKGLAKDASLAAWLKGLKQEGVEVGMKILVWVGIESADAALENCIRAEKSHWGDTLLNVLPVDPASLQLRSMRRFSGGTSVVAMGDVKQAAYQYRSTLQKLNESKQALKSAVLSARDEGYSLRAIEAAAQGAVSNVTILNWSGTPTKSDPNKTLRKLRGLKEDNEVS